MTSFTLTLAARASFWMGLLCCPLLAWSQTARSEGIAGSPVAAHDGQHDFDFSFGVWKTNIRRLMKPLTGSTSWVEMHGTKKVRKVWEGRAALEEVEADGPPGHFEGLSLFLYNTDTHQWSLTFANASDGTMSQPAMGSFKDGRGEFYDQETYHGRAIMVRIVWSNISASSHQFEQSFSDDGGKTWEPNFVATLTRDVDAEAAVPRDSAVPVLDSENHGFDWQLGNWKLATSRLEHPLQAGGKWIPLSGTVDVRKVWDGRANLAEIELDGPSGRIEFLSLRLYNPRAHQWSLNFATSGSNTLSSPMVGEFKHGRGEFYDQELVGDRTMFVRFVFDGLTNGNTRDEQAFSVDGGKTWRVNWINKQTRLTSQ